MPSGKFAGALTFALVFALLTSASPGTEKVLYSFIGGDDGDQPYAGVIFDNAGNLYGTTQFGGAHGAGVVFKLTPSSIGWIETVLYTFTGGTDGSLPLGSVVFDDAGNLYGAASQGGDPDCQCGVIYKLAPSGNEWTFSVLHALVGGNDGSVPASSLTYCCGFLRGTTVRGGSHGFGTAFSMNATGGFPFIVPFNGKNGNQPWAAPTGSHGTTYQGGKYSVGNVYELTFGRNARSTYVFNPAKPLGYHPLGPLLKDVKGNLYGTTYSGGIGGRGAVYGLFPIPGTSRYQPVALHGFTFTDGAGPASGLVIDAAGNLYGATVYGGTASPNADGVVFKLTPGLKNKWTETVLYNFSGGADGGDLYGTIVSDAAGNLYGTGIRGGAHGHGVVFKVIP
jgi:uncharacterized repeat protein (TIGR03803 family)